MPYMARPDKECADELNYKSAHIFAHSVDWKIFGMKKFLTITYNDEN